MTRDELCHLAAGSLVVLRSAHCASASTRLPPAWEEMQLERVTLVRSEPLALVSVTDVASRAKHGRRVQVACFVTADGVMYVVLDEALLGKLRLA